MVDNVCKIQGFPSQHSFRVFMEAEQPERSGILSHPPAKHRKIDPSDSDIVVLNLGAVGLKYHRIENHIQNAIGSWSLEFLEVLAVCAGLPRHLHDTGTQPLSCTSYSFLKINYFIFWLWWVFTATHRLSLVVVSGAALGCSAHTFCCNGFSCGPACTPGLVGSVVAALGLKSIGLVVVQHGLSGSMTCGIFPDQGPNLCPLHCKADS